MTTATLHPEPIDARVRPLAEVWAIAWPTVLTMLSYTVMQFVDKLMVGQVGPVHVAAQGNGGIWSFVPIVLMLGLITVVNTYVSQNLGAGHPEKGSPYPWAALWMSLGTWVVVLLPLAFAAPYLFPFMHPGQDAASFADLVRLESGYCQILLVGGLFTLSARSMHHFFFGLHRPRLITVAAILGNCVNVIINYILIFGEEGLPALNLPGIPGTPAWGLYGAAIGTVCGGFVEFIVPFWVFIGPKMNAELKTRRAWKPRLKPMRDLWKIGWPAAIQYGNEIVCWSLFMTVLVGQFGKDHMAAGWIALGYMHLSFMPAVGFSVAVSSLVGKYIGAGQPDIAVSRARLGLGLAMVYMTLCALGFFVFRYSLINLFVGGEVDGVAISPEQARHIIEIGAKLMICAAIFQTVDAFGIVYTGALRGAGDTVWPAFITVIFSWVFIIAGGWMMIWWMPDLGSVGPWIAASVYIILYGVTMAWRFESGHWRSIRLLENEEESTEPRQEAARVAPFAPGVPASGGEASVRDLAGDLGLEESTASTLRGDGVG